MAHRLRADAQRSGFATDAFFERVRDSYGDAFRVYAPSSFEELEGILRELSCKR